VRFPRLLVPILIIAAGCEADRTITAPKRFWSGHWWPFDQNYQGRKLYDPGDALDQYWRYLQATRSPTSPVQTPPTAPDQERMIPAQFGGPHACAGNCPVVGEDFCGHCNAFTAASMMEPEPTTRVIKTIIRYLVQDQNGEWVVGEEPIPLEGGIPPQGVRVVTTVIEFGVGHQKGLLTELWTNFTADSRGNINGQPDVTATEWQEMLDAFEAHGFAFDRAAGDPVWNHPVQEVKLWIDDDDEENGITVRDVEARIEYVEYTDADFVGQSTRTKTYNYRIRLRGDVVLGGQWIGEQPGSIFRPLVKRPANNRLVVDPCVREIINRGTETIRIRSTADFRPWPCT
jgi:hypothetical protein